MEWQRARQFGSASAILTLYRNSAGHEEAARAFPPLLADPTAIIVDRPPPQSSLSLSLSLDRDFRRLLVRVYPDYVAEYTSGRVFASFLSSRRVSFRPVNCACPTPRPRPLRARGVISPRGGSSGVGRRCVEEDRSTMDDESVRLMFFLTTMMMIMERRPREGLIFRRFTILVSEFYCRCAKDEI